MIATVTRPFTPADAAAYTGRHLNTIYTALQAGDLKGHQRAAPKGRWLIFKEDLDAWIRGE